MVMEETVVCVFGAIPVKMLPACWEGPRRLSRQQRRYISVYIYVCVYMQEVYPLLANRSWGSVPLSYKVDNERGPYWRVLCMASRLWVRGS